MKFLKAKLNLILIGFLMVTITGLSIFGGIVISNLKEETNKLNEKLDSYNVPTITTNVNDLKNQINELKTSLDESEEAIEELESLLLAANGNISENTNKLSTLEEKVLSNYTSLHNEIEERITFVQGEINKLVASDQSFNTKIGEIDKEIKTIKNTLNSTISSLNNLVTEVGNNSAYIRSIESNIDSIVNEISSIRVKMDLLEQSLSSSIVTENTRYDDLVDSIDTLMSDLRIDLDDLYESLILSSNRIYELDSSLISAISDISVLQNEVNELLSKNESLEFENETLNSTLNSTIERISLLETQIEQQRIQINCLSGNHHTENTEKIEVEWNSDYTFATATGYCDYCLTKYQEISPSFENEERTALMVSFSLFEGLLVKVDYVDGKTLEYEELNQKVKAMLESGSRDFVVHLAPNASSNLLTAIRRALLDTDGVTDGSVALTLIGITEIPDSNSYSYNEVGFGIYEEYYINDVVYERLTKLYSINLPSVTTIGEYAFSETENLKELIAPELLTIKNYAFFDCQIEKIDVPKLTSIGSSAFMFCEKLTEVNLPNVTLIDTNAFYSSNLKTMYLTSNNDVMINNNALGNAETIANMTLMLPSSKYIEVTNLNTWKGYTFKTIKYTCLDGSYDHSFSNIVNLTDKHEYSCGLCNTTVIEACYGGEATCMKQAECSLCLKPYGVFADHYHTEETGYCGFGCGTFVATYKVEENGAIKYGVKLETLQNVTFADGTKFTLLGDSVFFGHGIKSSYSIDLNGYDLTSNNSGFYSSFREEDVITINNLNIEKSSISVLKIYNSKVIINSNIDLNTITFCFELGRLDLTNADFESCFVELESIASFDIANITLGGYKIYNTSDVEVTDVLEKGKVYIIRK